MTELETWSWFEVEILPHEGDLRRYLSRFFKSHSDIDDAIQESYVRLLGLSDVARERVQIPRGFLFTTARNIAVEFLRKRRVVSLDVMVELESLAVVDERRAADEELNATQEVALLAAVVASLPERCRQVLTLRKFHGLSQKEIAQKMGITENTVEKHVAIGVRMCAERMSLRLGENCRPLVAREGSSKRRRVFDAK